MGVHLYESANIYAEILKYARYPDGLFEGSEAMKRALVEAIHNYRSR